MAFACEACGASARSARRLCLVCGVEAVGPVEDPPAVALPYADAGDEDEEKIPCSAPLALALGGVVVRKASVLIGGEPGAGKSTEAARLCCALGWRAIYLDAEMSGGEWRDTFAHAGATERQRERVRRMTAEDWQGALRCLEDLRPALAVVDSLHRFAPRDPERLDFLKGLRSVAARGSLVLVIAQANAKGEIAGWTAFEHEVRAVVIVTKEAVRGSKCRWAPESTAART